MPKNTKSKYFTYTFFMVSTVGLLGIVCDATITWTSPIFQKLESNDTSVNPFGRPITDSEKSWIASLINIGAMIGPFPFGFLAEQFGRKPAMLALAVPNVFAFLLFAFGTNVYFYYVARLLCGMALGASYALLPMYLAEIAHDSNRGMLSVTLNVFWTFGNLLPYILGAYLEIIWFNVILAILPAIFLAVFFSFGKETPHYLISRGKTEEAEESLRKFRESDNIKVEMESIRVGMEQEPKENPTSALVELFKTRIYLKSLGICLILIVAQQLSGIDAILTYTTDIFKVAGINSISPDECSIIIGVVLFVSSTITPFVVDKLGRKILLMASALGMALSHTFLGVYFFLLNSTDLDMSSLYWLPIVSIVLFITMYNLGMGSIPWTISSELFPSHVKSSATTIISVICWSISFLITQFYEDINDEIGQGETFWIFGACCFVSCIFTYFYVPETKGKSFQEIQQLLKRKR